jgi:hypothetical protein
LGYEPQAHHGQGLRHLVSHCLLREFAGQGRSTLAQHFHGAPTNRSQRVTLETDAPEILARCRQDQVDARCSSPLDPSVTRP